MSSSGVNLENVPINQEDINVAFPEYLKISEEADQIISMLHHENIIPFNYATFMGMLAYCLQYENKRKTFTWALRLKTCISVAKGLRYLHSGVGNHGRVIHGCVSSHSIKLNKNLEAKLCDLRRSVLVHGSQLRPEIYRPTNSDSSVIDPVYKESNILNIESDIYSYGILMFEILTGMVADGQGRAIGDYKEQKMINLVLRFHDDRPEQLIDPYIIDNVDRRSFHMFIEIAYKCITLNIKDRPMMDEIVKTIEEALDVHNQQTVSAIAKRKNSADSEKIIQFSAEEIRKATKNFSEETQIRKGDFNVVSRGHFSDRLQKPTAAIKIYLHDHEFKINRARFHSELQMGSMLHHDNIAPFIGYCDYIYNGIIVEYAANGSLDNQLKDPTMNITWAQRLEICIGVAKGLRYLHSGFGEYQRVINGDFGSRKILLYDNLEAKICGFGESFFFPGYGRDAHLAGPVGNKYYMDPVYRQCHIRSKESDVYSYGVVLFEILTGMLAYETRRIGVDVEPLNLVALVRRYYADQLDKLLDQRIRDEIDARSLYTFKEVAYKCISFNVKDRPSWNKIIKRLEEALYIQNHGAASNNTIRFRTLEDSFIPLKDINLAIGVKGQETRIGDGGFGVVYIGQPSERWQNRTVAIKCLRPESYQGEYEFRNELNMIFSFNRENIIPFIGYCDEGNEKIIVYEYASNGSLDGYINDKNRRNCLTWERRLKICLGAARGLDYLIGTLRINEDR